VVDHLLRQAVAVGVLLQPGHAVVVAGLLLPLHHASVTALDRHATAAPAVSSPRRRWDPRRDPGGGVLHASMDPAELSPKAGGGEPAAAEELIRRVEELEAAAHGMRQELDAERARPPPSGGRLLPISPPPHPAVGMSSSPSLPAPVSSPGSA